MSKLSDTQLVILNAAYQRDDRLVLPLPKSLKAAQRTRSSTASSSGASLKKWTRNATNRFGAKPAMAMA